jgi:hypothetical protein
MTMTMTDIKAAVALLPNLEKQLANAVKNHHGLRVSHKTTRAIITALRALEPIAAETHVILPREPTEKQIQYGNNEMAYVSATPSSVYRAMLRGFVGPFDEDQVASQEPKP